MKKFVELFVEFFKISLFVIGGGYAIIAVADEVFAKKGWTEEGELLEHLPVFQMIPGLIATHSAVYVGGKVAGRLGAFTAVVAVALPAVAIFTFVACGYDRLPVDNAYLKSVFVGLRAALTGIIAATILRGWKRNLDSAFAYGLMLAAVAAIAVLHVNVAIVLVAAAAIGISSAFLPRQGTVLRVSFLPLLLFLKYGALCFGGGFVIVPMYLEDFVGATAPYLQIPAEQFSNIMALSQMTPGPIGVNAVTFFGYKLFAAESVLAGVLGAVLASLLLLLPGSIGVYAVLSSLRRFKENRIVTGLFRGIRPASVALMLVAFWAFLGLSAFTVREDGGVDLHFVSIILTLITVIIVMKKKLNVIALIWLSAFAALALRADDITTERFPDADTVLVNEIEKVAYNPDGTYEQTDESWTKILTEKGRREESSTRLDYSKRYGEAKIVYVGAIDAQGNEREIDISKTTKEATDNGSMSANIYDPLDRVITATIPGLRIGETVHTRTWRRTVKPRCEGKWADISVMEWSQPILKSVFEVTAPKELPLRKIAIRHPLGNIVTNLTTAADGRKVYTFTAENSAQVFPEPDMPPLYTQVQHVRVSTAANWQEISMWYWNLCAPHLAKTNAAMVAKVEELKGGMAAAGDGGRKALLRAVYKFVSQEIRYMGLTMEDTSPGYAPHDVDVTFDNRYGVCRDKAGLLVTMLRLAGFKAFPVLIHAGAKLDREVPQPFFNHAIVAVENEAKGEDGKRSYTLMDPTDENAKDIFPTYLADKSYLVCREDGEDLAVSPVPPPADNELRVKTKGALSKDGSLFIENRITMNGINDTAYRHALVKMTPEDRVKFFDRIMKKVQPGAELIRCEVEPKDMRDTEKPIVISLAVSFPEMVLRGESRDELSVPFLSGVFGVANFLLRGNTSLEKRRYPLVLDTTARIEEELTLDLGGNLGEVLSLPPEERIAGGLEYFRTMSVSNGVLAAHRELTIGALEFDSEAYQELRESIKAIEASSRKRPVFAKDPLADADLRYLLDSTETTVLSDREWVTTNTVVKEVLTYAGKKGAAEMKFSFNPAWKRVEVVSAVVSNRNGKVAAVTPKEMNVMDAGWVAGAPRYPASKLLVVNLPSVEIGSVISCTVVVTVTNAPAPFYAAYLFDGHEPLVRRIVRVNDWRREVVNPKRLPDEPGQPSASFWRDQVIVSSNRFEECDLRIPDGLALPEELSGLTADGGDLTALRALRDWMAKYVKIAGPGLYEVPLGEQLTPPETILRERYATRLDYVRTLCALLRGAGYEADVVFAAGNANDPESVRNRIKYEKPNVRAFSAALCRVRVREGGFLGFGGEVKEYFLGTENQYAQLGASGYEGGDYYDPERGEFGVVTVPEEDLKDYELEKSVYTIRENGGVDLDVENLTYGTAVAGFRKTYSEILPEMRSRKYQQLLGAIAQAATATKDLETDVESYPACRRFSCFIPDYAVVNGDAITIRVPPLVSSIPTFTGKARETPFAVAGTDRESEEVTIRFPEGYTLAEHLPEPFVFTNPLSPKEVWLESTVSSEVKGGALEVVLRRTVHRRGFTWYGPHYLELVQDWYRIANSRANRTVVVRTDASRY